MKFRNIFWGVILIFAGVLFILQNLNIVYFDWVSMWRLWPVLLVLWGVSIIPVNDWIKVILVLVILGASVSFMLNRTEFYDDSKTFDFFSHRDYDNWDENDESTYKYTTQTFSIPYEDSATYVDLNMDAAAGKFVINNTTDDLLYFDRKGNSAEYSYILKTSDSTSDINIEMESTSINLGKNNRNMVNISLNKMPIWDIDLEAGAAKIDFDLEDYKVRKLDIEGGATSITIKLGELYPKSDINLSAGASEIVINVPKTSGCKLSLESVLSGKTLKGFEKTDRGEYITSNFDEAANKIYIDAEAAVSSFTIIRY